MIRLILSTILIISYSFGFSQDFEVGNTDTTFYGEHTVSDFGGYINLINNTSGNLSLKWKRTENSLPTGWVTSICDPTSCKPPESDSSNFTLPKTGTSNYINVHFYPDNVQGLGTTKVRVENVNDPSNFYVMSFVGDARVATGIEDENFSTTVSLYPNPSNGTLNISSSNDEMISVNVYNLIGEKVLSLQGVNKISEDISSLQTGMYLVEVNNGTNSFTEKLLVK